MARPQEFDRDAALTRALDVFWEKGFDAASVQDLVDRMGIGRGSLYATFGSKHDLFSEALDRYAERTCAACSKVLREPGSPRRALRKLFRDAIDAAADQPSCLALKSALTVCAEDKTSAARVARMTTRLENAFFEVLQRARAAGETPAGRNLRSLARFLTHSYQALHVTASVRGDRRVLRDVVRTTLSVLD